MSQSNEFSNSLQVPNQINNNESESHTDVPMMELPGSESTIKGEKTMGEFLAMMDSYAPIVNVTICTINAEINLFYRYLML